MINGHEIVVEAIPPEFVKSGWDVYGGLIDEALKYDLEGQTADDVAAGIEAGRLLIIQVSVNGECKAVSCLELAELAGEKLCHVLSITGTGIETWLPEFIAALQGVAESQDCDFVTMKGRPGWRKLLSGHGFEEMFTVMKMRVAG